MSRASSIQLKNNVFLNKHENAKMYSIFYSTSSPNVLCGGNWGRPVLLLCDVCTGKAPVQNKVLLLNRPV
uniref:Uncharacterized protein n=1 Tax=Anguilla anguilla TaxID=7936 RepID=A0A0E9WU65_ANGAN